MRSHTLWTYAYAQRYALRHGCLKQSDYRKLVKSMPKKKRLPYNPDRYYRSGCRGGVWVSWQAFLCKPPSKNRHCIQSLSYMQASAFAMRRKIQTPDEWAQLCATCHDYTLATNPAATYAQDWVSWPFFLGIGIE